MSKPVYTIMPDFGGAYCWRKRGDSLPWSGVGGNIAGFGGWGGDLPISSELEESFIKWQSEFEGLGWADKKTLDYFDWVEYHRRGVLLSHRLKKELGEKATIIYEKAFEDPCHHDAERLEILAGGLIRILPSRKRQEQMAAVDKPSN